MLLGGKSSNTLDLVFILHRTALSPYYCQGLPVQGNSYRLQLVLKCCNGLTNNWKEERARMTYGNEE